MVSRPAPLALLVVALALVPLATAFKTPEDALRKLVAHNKLSASLWDLGPNVFNKFSSVRTYGPHNKLSASLWTFRQDGSFRRTYVADASSDRPQDGDLFLLSQAGSPAPASVHGPAPAPASPAPTVDRTAAATVSMSLAGEGLWDWIQDNKDDFKAAFITDVAKIAGIDERHISNVQVEEGFPGDTASALLAEQSVLVTFDIAADASDTFTALELGEAFKESVNTGGAKMSAVENKSGITIEAEVQEVGAADGAKNPAAAKPAPANGFGLGAIIGIAAGSIFLIICAVCLYRRTRKISPDVRSPTQNTEDDAAEMQETGKSK